MGSRGAGTGTSTQRRNRRRAAFTKPRGIKPRRASVGSGVRPSAVRSSTPARDRRWPALYVLCAGILMVVIDGTIVNVALPSIQSDLGFTQSTLAWIVNSYLIAFGGLLLLSGRLGDLVG